jgi:hypothetical protein
MLPLTTWDSTIKAFRLFKAPRQELSTPNSLRDMVPPLATYHHHGQLKRRPSMPDYYSVIATAVSRLPTKTDEARCAIYDCARTALQEALRDYEPPLLAKEQMALDEAIRTVEVINDIQLEASLIRANNGPDGSPPSVCAVE